MTYSVRIKASAAKTLGELAKPQRVRLIEAIDALKLNPASGSLLKGELTGLRRIRVGDYRIIFEVQHGELIVLVIRIGHRRDVYLTRANGYPAALDVGRCRG